MMHNNILGLIILIALDNNIPMKPILRIQWPHEIDWNQLDNDAAKLNIGEAEIFCCGEDTEMKIIMDKYDLQKLHDILNRVFDGDLSDTFYRA